MTRKYFGTDGIRGCVGEFPITADFMMRLGWAAGRVLGEQTNGRRLFIVGKDTRVSGYLFESALQAGLISSGADVGLLGPMPTPAIAYLTRTFKAQAGIVISASHNAHQDNGIKFFSGDGYKLPDEIERKIEEYLDNDFVTEESHKLGKAWRVEDAPGRYIEYCKSTVSRDFNLNGMKIVLDCAHGATYHIAPKVFGELGAEVISIGVKPDGTNINAGHGATDTKALSAEVVAQGADMGIAFDGDGDRVAFVDKAGVLIDGDALLLIVADYLNAKGSLRGVVGTLMSNFGLELALEERGLGFHRANVGDRYVIESMLELGYELGGETSGHIICGEMGTTGDGVVSALQVLESLAHMGQSLEQAAKNLDCFPQVLVNVPIEKQLSDLSHPQLDKAVAEVESELAGKGRVLLRPSGTEPLIRVMVEGEDGEVVTKLAHKLGRDVAAVYG